MLKATVLAVSLLIGISASAQDSPIQFGVKAGLNLSNFGGKAGDDLDAKIGFNVGVTVDYALTEDVYLLSGLELTTKGAKLSESGAKLTFNPMYLQLPIHAGYKLAIAEGTKLVFHAGPYLAYGIGGKAKLTGAGDEDYKIDFFGSEEEGGAKSFDFGVGLGVGAEFGQINAGLGYDFGLANISRSDDAKLKTQNAYLTVGYKF